MVGRLIVWSFRSEAVQHYIMWSFMQLDVYLSCQACPTTHMTVCQAIGMPLRCTSWVFRLRLHVCISCWSLHIVPYTVLLLPWYNTGSECRWLFEGRSKQLTCNHQIRQKWFPGQSVLHGTYGRKAITYSGLSVLKPCKIWICDLPCSLMHSFCPTTHTTHRHSIGSVLVT